MDMSSIHQVWPNPSCKAQWKGEEDRADRRRGGKTTSGNGQVWSLSSPRGQWRTENNAKGKWLLSHLWCPNGSRSNGIREVCFPHFEELKKKKKNLSHSWFQLPHWRHFFVCAKLENWLVTELESCNAACLIPKSYPNESQKLAELT